MHRTVAFVMAMLVYLSVQVLLPGFVGLANNGDFGKVLGRFCVEGTDLGSSNFIYFQSDYQETARACWDSGIQSSESLFVASALKLSRALVPGPRFDIRWTGALHALGFLGAFVLWLRCFRPLQGARWWIASTVAAIIIGDAGYVTYANSFYTDTPALLGAMMAVPAMVRYAEDPSIWNLGWLLGGLGLFLGSKGQHAATGAVCVLVAILLVRTWPVKLLAGIFLVVVSAWTLSTVPDWYKTTARFNVIFYKILPNSPSVDTDLRELGLKPEYARFSGLHAFLAGSPTNNPTWASEFMAAGGYSALFRFWLRHPLRTLGTFGRDLATEAQQRRAVNLSNFQKESARPPGAKTQFVSWWSDFRSALFRLWPWHLLVWVLILPATMRRGPRPYRLLLTATVALGLIEAGIASLSDALETYRHLLLFHWFTDATVLLVLLRYFKTNAVVGGIDTAVNARRAGPKVR